MEEISSEDGHEDLKAVLDGEFVLAVIVRPDGQVNLVGTLDPKNVPETLMEVVKNFQDDHPEVPKIGWGAALSTDEKTTMLKLMGAAPTAGEAVRRAAGETAEAMRRLLPDLSEVMLGRFMFHASGMLAHACVSADSDTSLARMAAVFSLAGLDLSASELLHD